MLITIGNETEVWHIVFIVSIGCTYIYSPTI